MAAIRGASESSFGDVIGEALGGFGHQVSEFFWGDLNEDARASKSAREETISAFGTIAGMKGKVPEEAKAYFDQVKALRLNEEKGRELFEGDRARFGGEDIKTVIDRILAGINGLITAAVNTLAEKLNPTK